MSARSTNLLDAEIRHATLIRAKPEQVYDALSTGAGWDAWFTSGAQVDARPGGDIRLRWVEWGPDRVTAEDGGPVLEAIRPESFIFQWHPDNLSYTTTVEITIGAVDGGTVVRLREAGYHNTREGRAAFANCATGWGEALTLLKFYVEHGIRY